MLQPTDRAGGLAFLHTHLVKRWALWATAQGPTSQGGYPRNLTHGPTLHCPKQYRRPSSEPITTRPEAIAGEADSGAPALNSHTFAPVL